ncbi:MAG: low affinity iron permease family protein [Myxococcales bacterium]|nr:low affinity iron permease family protein [Myxococcales bacterium]
MFLRVARKQDSWFRRFSCAVAERVGSHWAFLVALAVVIVWGVTGPMFHYSDSWQLVINTGTTIVTFLMVFLIQATQNKDGKAVQLKLDELIRAQKSARNVFADLEHASDEELKEFAEEFKALRAKGLPHETATRKAASAAAGARSSSNRE